jgi:hypothetical protein
MFVSLSHGSGEAYSGKIWWVIEINNQTKTKIQSFL